MVLGAIADILHFLCCVIVQLSNFKDNRHLMPKTYLPCFQCKQKFGAGAPVHATPLNFKLRPWVSGAG